MGGNTGGIPASRLQAGERFSVGFAPVERELSRKVGDQVLYRLTMKIVIQKLGKNGENLYSFCDEIKNKQHRANLTLTRLSSVESRF